MVMAKMFNVDCPRGSLYSFVLSDNMIQHQTTSPQVLICSAPICQCANKITEEITSRYSDLIKCRQVFGKYLPTITNCNAVWVNYYFLKGVHIAETVHASTRGCFAVFQSLFICIGILVVLGFGYCVRDWRTLSWICLVPYFVHLIMIFFLHDTPYWLVEKKMRLEARLVDKYFPTHMNCVANLAAFTHQVFKYEPNLLHEWFAIFVLFLRS